MRHRNIFIPVFIIFLFGALLSNSQISFRAIQSTPTEELVERIKDDSSRQAFQYIIKENKEQKNEIKLLSHDIMPPEK